MSSRAVVIDGEASETDSEDETQGKLDDFEFSDAVQGTLVIGEDTESDNESDRSVASAVSALDQVEDVKQPVKQPIYNSLLHRKLREDNAAFHNNLEGFCNSLLNEACNTLSGMDHQMVHSEVTLQNALTALRSVNTNSDSLKNKLHSMLSDNFLSNVKVDK